MRFCRMLFCGCVSFLLRVIYLHVSFLSHIFLNFLEKCVIFVSALFSSKTSSLTNS